MDQQKDRVDAGLRSLNHYKNRLPRWRHNFRESVLPLVRWETQYVALLQQKLRTPALDSYFAIIANLGTHTFFMVMLPILFWCGYTTLARSMIHMLAAGVFFSGVFKDMLCLPRPLSPPLQRITMSGSAALEYGFPSTHSTNAISVAFYTLFYLIYDESSIPANVKLVLESTVYVYGFSIVLGRLYCGMHGFLDVIFGGLLGAVVAAVQCSYGATFDDFIYIDSVKNVLITVLIILVLVRIHPEPVDDCPCYEDSVAFAGVMIGIESGSWHFARTDYAWSDPVKGTVPFDIGSMGWVLATIRIAVGILMIFAWRGTMKPTLLRVLPPVFRFVEQFGLLLPRRFFKPASEYKRVPYQSHDDNIIPAVSEIPNMLTSLRRRRAVSIGPQSEADAYETMAYREQLRRDSMSTSASTTRKTVVSGVDLDSSYFNPRATNGTTALPTKDVAVGGEGSVNTPSGFYPATSPVDSSDAGEAVTSGQDDSDLFSNLTKPRVRYDVEVVTKLVVYAGIGWLACEMCPIFFEIAGLGSR